MTNKQVHEDQLTRDLLDDGAKAIKRHIQEPLRDRVGVQLIFETVEHEPEDWDEEQGSNPMPTVSTPSAIATGLFSP